MAQHARFHYTSLDELKNDIARLGLDIPASSDMGILGQPIDIDGTRVLFAQDIGAPLLKDFDCGPTAWMESIQKLFALDADILCDGHSGAYAPKKNVKRYLEFCVKSQAQQGHTNL